MTLGVCATNWTQPQSLLYNTCAATHPGWGSGGVVVVRNQLLSIGCCCSVALCMSNSVTPWTAAHQASRPSPSFGACSNSHPLSLWCHPTIWSSVVPFSFCLQSFPASGSFLMSWLFASGGQSIGASASAPSNEYSGLISFRTDRFDLLAVQGTGWCTIKISRTL